MKEFIVYYEISGSATASVKAKNLEEATEKAKRFEVEEGSDVLNEWSFEEFSGIDKDESN